MTKTLRRNSEKCMNSKLFFPDDSPLKNLYTNVQLNFIFEKLPWFIYCLLSHYWYLVFAYSPARTKKLKKTTQLNLPTHSTR